VLNDRFLLFASQLLDNVLSSRSTKSQVWARGVGFQVSEKCTIMDVQNTPGSLIIGGSLGDNDRAYRYRISKDYKYLKGFDFDKGVWYQFIK